jgi:hypothetical protein
MGRQWEGVVGRAQRHGVAWLPGPRGFVRVRLRCCRQVDGETGKGAREIGHEARPVRRGRCRQHLDQSGKAAAALTGRRLIGPAQQEERRQDRMERNDRDDHQRRDLSANGREAERSEEPHRQPVAPDSATSTFGVNI